MPSLSKQQALTWCTEIKAFSNIDGSKSACCDATREQYLKDNLYTPSLPLPADCEPLHRQVVCGECHPWSLHLYPPDLSGAMALKSDFCAQYYNACAKALNLAADYCDRVAAKDMQGDPVYVDMTYPFVDEVKSTGTLTRLFDASIKLPGPVTGMYIRPGTNKWWVVGRQGVIKEIANDPKATASSIADILDITDRVIQDNQTWAGGQWEQGLLSMAFSPDFLTTGYFYVYYLKLTNAAIYERKALVSRFTWTGSSATTKDTEVIMMGIVQDTDFHKAGQLMFEPGDIAKPASKSAYNLYLPTGESGNSANSQNLQSLKGKMLRIQVPAGVNSGNYTIPQGNIQGEVWAYGLRNPWRCSMNRANLLQAEIWCGDVGDAAVEEVTRVVANGNHGWPYYEGTRVASPLPADGITNVPPVYQYCHTAGSTLPQCDKRLVGASVIGGFVYSGTRQADQYKGHYLFADYATGGIVHLIPGADDTWTSAPILTAGFNIATLAEDNNGEVYIVKFDILDPGVYYFPNLSNGMTGTSTTVGDSVEIPSTLVRPTPVTTTAQGLTTYLIHLWEYDYEPLLGAANNHKHYSDLDDVNKAGAGYRGAQGVDTDGTGVGWVLTNEYLQYTLTTFSAGKYIVKLNAGGPTELGGGSMQMDVFPGPGANAGVIPLQTYTLEHTATGGWNIKRDDVVATGIDMKAAPFTIRLTALSSGLNLQDITFVQTSLATGGTAATTTSSGALTSGSTTGAVDAGTGLLTYKMLLANYDYVVPGGLATNEAINYHDADPVNNAGNGFRGGEAVDATADEIGWATVGEWTQYTVADFKSGRYKIELTACGPNDIAVPGGSIRLDFFQKPGPNIATQPLATVNMVHSSTGGWAIPGTQTSAGAEAFVMPAAPFTVRVTTTREGLNLRSLTFTEVPAPATVEGTVEAEQFDRGGAGIGYQDNTPANTGGATYRTLEGVDLAACKSASCNGYTVAAAAGEWLKYTIQVTQAGTYTASLKLATATAAATSRLRRTAVAETSSDGQVNFNNGIEPKAGGKAQQARNLALTDTPPTLSGVNVYAFVAVVPGRCKDVVDPVCTTGAPIPYAGSMTDFVSAAAPAAYNMQLTEGFACLKLCTARDNYYIDSVALMKVLPPTPAPTTAPPTPAPTAAPTTLPPTAAPTTLAPTAAPTTLAPTSAPTTLAPTPAPTTLPPTPAPTTLAPTPAPTTQPPTAAPTVPAVLITGPVESVVDKTSGLPTYKITLSNYDYVDGGINTNVNYFDKDAANKGDATFRGNQGVDATAGIVSWTEVGEWTQYTVADFKAGTYKIELAACGPTELGGGAVTLDFFKQPGANANAAPLKTVVLNHAATGGWGAPTVESSLGAVSVALPTGPFTVRMTVIKAGLNLFYLAFTQLPAAIVPAYPGLMSPVAGVTVDNAGMSKYFILLAEYDYVPGAVNDPTHYHDTEVQNKASTTYRLGEGVDAAGNMWGNVGFIAAGEYTQYTLATFKAGKYVPYLSAAGPPVLGGCTIQLDFFQSPGPNTGVQPFLTMTVQHAATINWGDYSDSPAIPAAAIPAGPWTLRVLTTKAGCNYRSLSFVQTS